MIQIEVSSREFDRVKADAVGYHIIDRHGAEYIVFNDLLVLKTDYDNQKDSIQSTETVL